MSRLGKQIGAAVAMYRALPEDFRQRFEAGLGAARDALACADEMPPELRKALLDAGIAIFVEGKLGGNWSKVAEALKEAAPELYPHLAPLLGGSDGIRVRLPL